jgi:DNA-binding response OmpR family regulator
VKIALEHEGYEVLVAHDGKEGLKRAREERPDLVLLDLMLPNIDGYKVCRLLKFDERYRDIPILIMSARSNPEDVQLARQVGADDFIPKPFDPDDLIRRVGRFLGVGTS